MEIAVAEQGSYCVAPAILLDEARGRAAAAKASAFGGITQLFSRPKPDDVTVEARGLRFEPLWHATAHVRFVYDRKETYRFPIKLPEHVESLSIGASTFTVEADGKERTIGVHAVAHCVREFRKDVWIDGASAEHVPARVFDAAATQQVDLGTFVPADGALVEPTVRASAVVRELLGSDAAPPEADVVHEQIAEIERLDLFMHPMYEFQLVWAAKSKTVTVVVDALSGELEVIKAPLHPVLGRLLHKDTLFDIGSETLNLVVPGGAIPLKIVQALHRKATRE